jgi:hypothetical protein
MASDTAAAACPEGTPSADASSLRTPLAWSGLRDTRYSFGIILIQPTIATILERTGFREDADITSAFYQEKNYFIICLLGALPVQTLLPIQFMLLSTDFGQEQIMKDAVFAPISLSNVRDEIDAPASRDPGGTGRLLGSRFIIRLLHRAILRLEGVSFNHGRLPHGWERGL